MNLKKYIDQMIEWRRYLHAHPEPSFQEYQTVAYIEEELRKVGLTQFQKPTETSLLVRIKGEKQGPIIGLRADIDALPIQEEREELDFMSTNDGYMHACGHDAHSAMLMATGYYLQEHLDELSGEICLIFQHAEELFPGGAIEIVNSGMIDDLDFIFGQHIMTTVDLGKFSILEGAITANTDVFTVKIIGEGVHSSSPQAGIDPVIIGANSIVEMQQIISRMLNPLNGNVISNTWFESGASNALNIIPATASFGASIRSQYDEDKLLIQDKIEMIIKKNCELYGADYELDYISGYPAILNDKNSTAIIRKIAREIEGTEIVAEPMGLGGEDFSYFSRKTPSTFVVTGVKSEGYDYPHHNPKFCVDERGLTYGLELNLRVALEYHKYL